MRVGPGKILAWWVKDYAYAAVWQLRALFGPRDAHRYRSGTLRPVVMLPGVWETWSFLRPLIVALHEQGHPVHIIRGLRLNGRPIATTAEAVSAQIAAADLRNVAIVAHSKGGLIGKYVMSELDPDGRIDRMIAVCTPFAGSEYARYAMLASLREFSPQSPVTLHLQRDESVNPRITTITGVFDPHIPRIVDLPGATRIVVDEGGHFRLLGLPEVVRMVVDLTR